MSAGSAVRAEAPLFQQVTGVRLACRRENPKGAAPGV